MRRSISLYLFLGLLSGFAVSCAKGDALLVSAASSLHDVFTELNPAAEKAIGREIRFNFAGSGTLRHQIENGAPADVFVSASKREVDLLAAVVSVDEKTRATIAYNTLVVIGAPGSFYLEDARSMRALLDEAPRFALGDPNIAPVGWYAQEAIKSLKPMRSSTGRIVYAHSAKQVVSTVETRAVRFGFVFANDAKASVARGKSSIVHAFPPMGITYQAVVLALSPHATVAENFIRFLKSDEAQDAFSRAGFVSIRGEDPQ